MMAHLQAIQIALSAFFVTSLIIGFAIFGLLLVHVARHWDDGHR